MGPVKFLLSFLLVVISIESGYALKCYACGAINSKCQDPFEHDESLVVNVPITSVDIVNCVKVTVGGLVQRQVGSAQICDQFSENCYKCNTDLCNASTGLVGSSILLVLTLLLVKQII